MSFVQQDMRLLISAFPASEAAIRKMHDNHEAKKERDPAYKALCILREHQYNARALWILYINLKEIHTHLHDFLVKHYRKNTTCTKILFAHQIHESFKTTWINKIETTHESLYERRPWIGDLAMDKVELTMHILHNLPEMEVEMNIAQSIISSSTCVKLN